MGNLARACQEHAPLTIRGWGSTWLREARVHNVPFRILPEGAPWFPIVPGSGEGMGAGGSTKIQGAAADVVRKAAAQV